ncbi:MAG: L-threonine 3-dehydrogenase [Actinobacteria bacterium]|nr:L-threonine 3-dehydrogenase [Actinomycetota bacterium]
MRALRKTGPAPGAELEEVPVPDPLPGEVLIRIDAASICGTDLHIFEWNSWAAGRMSPPITFGHEMTGRVARLGQGVEHLEVGTRVSVETHLFDGTCTTCRAGRFHICENLRILGVDAPGGFAEFISVPAVNAWQVGAGVPPEVASIYEPFGNAVHTVFPGNDGGDVAGEAVAVVGCGPIGLFAVGICRASGARQVVAVEPNEFRAGLAKQMGADLVVDPRSADPVAAVLEATGGHGAGLVLEMSGNATAIDQATRMLARGGRLSFLGLPTQPVTVDLTDQVIFKEARLVGITGRELFRTWQLTSTFLETGMVDVQPVITHRFPLDRYAEAFEAAASGRSAKVILYP